MKTYQVVISASDLNDLEAAHEAALEVQSKFPNLKVEIYETKSLNIGWTEL